MDIINSDHDYSRENYMKQIQSIISHPQLGGIMLYGLDNDQLSLKQRHEWFLSIKELINGQEIEVFLQSDGHPLDVMVC